MRRSEPDRRQENVTRALVPSPWSQSSELALTSCEAIMIRRSSAAPTNFTQDLDGSTVVLLREITHRINNEFASLIGLMQRGARELTDARAKALFESMIECLYSHAEV